MTTATISKTNSKLELTPIPNALRMLTLATVLGVIGTLYLALVNVGTDVEQGDVQRLFYVHMPVFFGSFTAFGATVLGGIMYLTKRDPKWDRLAVAGVEVGLALSTINLLTGIAWMRPIWNSWWLWDPRLTSAAIMVLTYAAYLMLRAGIENPDTRRRFASVYGILAITTVILTLVIIRIRPDTIHPAVIGPSPQNAQGEFEATTGVVIALIPALIFYSTLFPITLMWYRIRLENMFDALAQRKAEVLG
jgi:heme exporter protein C